MFREPEIKVTGQDIQALREQGSTCLAKFHQLRIREEVPRIHTRVTSLQERAEVLASFDDLLSVYIGKVEKGDSLPWFPMMTLTLEIIERVRLSDLPEDSVREISLDLAGRLVEQVSEMLV